MSRVLLATHAFLWAIADDSRLGPLSRELILGLSLAVMGHSYGPPPEVIASALQHRAVLLRCHNSQTNNPRAKPEGC